jgi:hypothetical protein
MGFHLSHTAFCEKAYYEFECFWQFTVNIGLFLYLCRDISTIFHRFDTWWINPFYLEKFFGFLSDVAIIICGTLGILEMRLNSCKKCIRILIIRLFLFIFLTGVFSSIPFVDAVYAHFLPLRILKIRR